MKNERKIGIKLETWLMILAWLISLAVAFGALKTEVSYNEKAISKLYREKADKSVVAEQLKRIEQKIDLLIQKNGE